MTKERIRHMDEARLDASPEISQQVFCAHKLHEVSQILLGHYSITDVGQDQLGEGLVKTWSIRKEHS